ncbi:proline-rich proteoglycan 2-like [Drosophila busckii]|uniref:proline-rich proteoglycan 2-like n=1 Tax=Drosophila busckii TaxID=30019 RepID=UPI00083ECFCD|nr:proline-rich proteoglycan 2-like [Drosophila busckii]
MKKSLIICGILLIGLAGVARGDSDSDSSESGSGEKRHNKKHKNKYNNPAYQNIYPPAGYPYPYPYNPYGPPPQQYPNANPYPYGPPPQQYPNANPNPYGPPPQQYPNANPYPYPPPYGPYPPYQLPMNPPPYNQPPYIVASTPGPAPQLYGPNGSNDSSDQHYGPASSVINHSLKVNKEYKENGHHTS